MQQFQGDQPLTYVRKQASADMFRYIKAVGLPIACFLLSMFSINTFGLFGANLMAPFTGAMWLTGIVGGFLLPQQRLSNLRETHIMIIGYHVGLMIIREAIALISGISSEMLMATYGQAIPVASGQAFSGYLQTMLWITAAIAPVVYIVNAVKKIFSFRRQDSVKRTHNRMLGTVPNRNHYDE